MSVCDSVKEEQPDRCGFYTFVADGSCAPSGIDREVQCTMRPDASGPRTRVRADDSKLNET